MLNGEGVSPGIVVASVVVSQLFIEQEQLVKKRKADADAEFSRFELALYAVAATLKKHQKKASETLNDDAGLIFNAQMLMLLDEESVINPIKVMIFRDSYSVEYAVWSQLNNLAQVMLTLKSAYLQERASDFFDLRNQLMQVLLGVSAASAPALKKPIIFVAHSVSPSDIFSFERDNLSGIISEKGSYTSHASVLARALGIPAVVGAHNILDKVSNGNTIAMDGNSGTVWLSQNKYSLARPKKLQNF